MFDIMFTLQKRNKTALLIRIVPHEPFIRLAQISKAVQHELTDEP